MASYRDVPGGGKEFLLFVTGRSKADGKLQRIGLAKSDDGHNSRGPRSYSTPPPRWATTSPTTMASSWPGVTRSCSATTRTADGTCSSPPRPPCRQARRSPPSGTPSPGRRPRTVGASVPASTAAALPPARGPVAGAAQRPVLPVRLHPEQPRQEHQQSAKQAAFRGYVAPSLLGPWEFVYGETDLIYGHKIYAPLVFERGQGSGRSTPRWPSSPRTPSSPSPPRPSSISSGRWTSTWGGKGPSLTL